MTRKPLLVLTKPLAAPLLLLGALLLFPTVGHLTFVDTPPFDLALPTSVGQWQLNKILFCQNDQCMQTIEYSDFEPATCPACHHTLGTAPLGERQNLPQDTLITHGRYKDAAKHRIDIAIVVSGRSRSSIHKPEQCLAGQGYRILKDSYQPLSSKSHSLRLFDIERSVTDTTGIKTSQTAFFAFWFTGPQIQTASSLVRTWHMSLERILEGKAYRWAYVSMLIPQDRNREDTVLALSDFAKELDKQLRHK